MTDATRSPNEDVFNRAILWNSAVPDLPDKDMLIWERELLGLYLSSHPLRDYLSYLREQTLHSTRFEPILDQRMVHAGGLVKSIRQITTKSGSKMAFVLIEDETNEYEAIVFPTVYEKHGHLFEVDKVLRILGRLGARERDGSISTTIKLLVEEAIELDLQTVESYQPTGNDYVIPAEGTLKPRRNGRVDAIPANNLYLRVLDAADQTILIGIKKLIESSPGHTNVVLVLGDAENKTPMKLPIKSSTDSRLIGALKDFIGAENVILR